MSLLRRVTISFDVFFGRTTSLTTTQAAGRENPDGQIRHLDGQLLGSNAATRRKAEWLSHRVGTELEEEWDASRCNLARPGRY